MCVCVCVLATGQDAPGGTGSVLLTVSRLKAVWDAGRSGNISSTGTRASLTLGLCTASSAQASWLCSLFSNCAGSLGLETSLRAGSLRTLGVPQSLTLPSNSTAEGNFRRR